MNPVARFGEYAAAFERAFEDDDWSVLEPYFTDDAVYETLAGPPFGGRHEGRDALFAALKRSLDTYDRRFDTRELALLEGPEDRDGAAWIRWRATYRVGDAPPMVIEGEETAYFEGDRIVRLEDRFSEESGKGALEWMEQHGESLKPAAS